MEEALNNGFARYAVVIGSFASCLCLPFKRRHLAGAPGLAPVPGA
jgi:hypothetical protein